MTSILHLSDLHFGTVAPEKAKALLDSIETLKPDLTVVSGDLTQRARKHQFQGARSFLAQFQSSLLVVPGNHDNPLYNLPLRLFFPMLHFRQYISEDLAPTYDDENLAVLGLDSSNPRGWKEGVLSDQQLERVREYFETAGSRLRILVTHHPMLAQLPLQRRWRRRKFELGKESSPDLLLSGHLHETAAGAVHNVTWNPDHSVLLIQAGSTLSHRTRMERNSFNHLEIEEGAILLTVYRWSGSSFSRLKSRSFFRDAQGKWEEETKCGGIR